MQKKCIRPFLFAGVMSYRPLDQVWFPLADTCGEPEPFTRPEDGRKRFDIALAIAGGHAADRKL